MFMQLTYLPPDALPEAVGNMLVGMGLFRAGFFTLKWSNRAYGALIAFGYLVAAPLTAWLAWLMWKSNFEPVTLHQLGEVSEMLGNIEEETMCHFQAILRLDTQNPPGKATARTAIRISSKPWRLRVMRCAGWRPIKCTTN